MFACAQNDNKENSKMKELLLCESLALLLLGHWFRHGFDPLSWVLKGQTMRWMSMATPAPSPLGKHLYLVAWHDERHHGDQGQGVGVCIFLVGQTLTRGYRAYEHSVVLKKKVCACALVCVCVCACRERERERGKRALPLTLWPWKICHLPEPKLTYL